MYKRYQIFISSTFNDLKEERKVITQDILRKGYYPAGMEWFPGIDEEQFEYIKQVIDDSDYFRLGSDMQRIDYFRNQYDHWWNTLKKEYSKIKFHFVCVNDFKTSFRGVIINREIGLVGFYVRVNDTTLGTLEDSIYVDKNTNVGTMHQEHIHSAVCYLNTHLPIYSNHSLLMALNL